LPSDCDSGPGQDADSERLGCGVDKTLFDEMNPNRWVMLVIFYNEQVRHMHSHARRYSVGRIILALYSDVAGVFFPPLQA